ncbi:MAG: sulfotransferase domain-containing protein [Erythrobacter sp.]
MITTLKKRVGEMRRSGHDARLQDRLSQVDGFLVSYPKSGRTWLRYLLSIYFARRAELAFEPDLHSTFRVLPNFDLDKQRGLPAYDGGSMGPLPLVAVSHRDYDAKLFGSVPVIVLLRDPRDVLVSSYFHQTRHKHRFDGSIGAFLDSPEFGAQSIADYHNRWASGLEDRRSLAISYEDMSANTESVVTRVLDFLGVPVDEQVLRDAVEKARFESMQKKERKTGIPGHEYDRKDADASRVRRGKVAGYEDYLSAAEGEYIRQVFAERLTEAAKQLYRPTGFLT